MTDTRDLRFGTPSFEVALEERFDPEVRDVLRLSAELCSIPSVSVPAGRADFTEVARAAALARRFAEERGLRVLEREPGGDSPYPFLVVTFRESDLEDPSFGEAVALIGHLDVVPARDESQFSPFLREDDLHARGAADMKTVVATWLVWMGRLQQDPGPKPPFVLLLSCCEENGSDRPHHAGSVIRWLHDTLGVTVRFGVVGERTGELEWMGDDLTIGPVCRENRSWRWIRASSGSAAGLPALERFARAAALCRTTVAELNEELERSERARLQPGLRSGFLNPFAFIAGDRGAEDLENAVCLTVGRESGASVHSAVADIGVESLAERFHAVAVKAAGRFGAERVHLSGVRIGQEGNFNTWDGSGEMWLVLEGATSDDAKEWIDGLEEPGLTLLATEGAGPARTLPTAAGFDLRELLDHRELVEDMLVRLRKGLWDGCSFQVVNNCPPWRCPEDHPDLQRLLAAYESLDGKPSPDLVKLHGNDGGNLVAWQQEIMPDLVERGEGHAVVFGQVGRNPHGPEEFHRGTSIRPYLKILHRWAASYTEP